MAGAERSLTGYGDMVGIEADKPQEACGVFGVYAPGVEVVKLAYLGAQAGQHRGQDAAGIAAWANGIITSHKDRGLVSEVFHSTEVLETLDPTGEATIAAAHTLYGTSGSGNGYQLVDGHGADGRAFVLGHNGHLEPSSGQGIGQFPSDSYWLTDRIGRHWAGGSLEDACIAGCREATGAYSCVVMGDGKLIAFRDPNGIRPLEIGQLPEGKGFIVASETGGFRKLNATHMGSVEPGTLISIDDTGITTTRFAESDQKLCIFEHVYFARTTSELDGVSVNAGRQRSGALLAEQQPVDADVVIGVPNSGLAAAEGYARASGIPFRLGLERNPYITRTFIKESFSAIRSAVQLKLDPHPDVIQGERVVVVDDSIVRGNTMEELVAMLWEAGAAEVHLRIASPPNKWSCYYGMATGDQDQLLANQVKIEQMAEHFGVNSFEYLTLDNLLRAIGRPIGQFCTGCLTGVYPTEIPAELTSRK